MAEVYLSQSPEETRRLGEKLGARLKPGDLVLLFGDLGAGKTTFVQGLARGLGVPPETYVSSPSFALVHEYQGRIPLYHVDLYRLSPEETEDLGLAELLSQGAMVIEWAERLAENLPVRFKVFLRYLSEGKREVRIEEGAPNEPLPEDRDKGGL